MDFLVSGRNQSLRLWSAREAVYSTVTVTVWAMLTRPEAGLYFTGVKPPKANETPLSTWVLTLLKSILG